MKYQLILNGEDNNFSIVFQITQVVDEETVVVASDIRSGLTKEQAVAAAEAALIQISEN
jgi:hypothetical protein